MTTLVFTAPGWQWIAVVATAAAVVLASLEWRRSGPRRALRAALVAVAVLALGVIGMRPARSRPISDSTSLVIVTANRGAPDRQTKAQAAAIADSLQAALILRDTIPDLAWLRRRQPAIDTLHVVGAGLDAADRRAASGLAVRVHPVTPQRGLVQLAWTRAAAVGQPILVSGRFVAPAGTLVHLEGPGGTVDSIRTDSVGGFSFATLPRAPGRQLHVLTAGAGAAMVAETLGVAVEPRHLPRVLVLEAAPGFETRHLKTWLGAQGGEVAVRSLMGRDVHRYEHVNRPELPLASITASVLSAFDVVVTDGRTLASLSSPERAALKGAIADSGRGLLLLADDVVLGAAGSLPDREFFVAAEAVRLPGPSERSVRAGWASRPVPAANWSLREGFASVALGQTGDRGGLARIAPRGAGRVAVTVVREPGRWLLAGDSRAFGEYWTRLLTPLAESVRRPRWEIAGPGPIVANAAVHLSLASSDSVTAATVTGPDGAVDTVQLLTDRLEPARRRAAWWPRHAGWHRIAAGGTALDFHVVATSSPGLSGALRQGATLRTATRSAAVYDSAELPLRYDPSSLALRPVGLLPVFVVLVVALAGLWIAGGPRMVER